MQRSQVGVLTCPSDRSNTSLLIIPKVTDSQQFEFPKPAVQPSAAEVLDSDEMEPTLAIQDLLDRPEAIVIVIVAIMVAFWQLYLALLEEPDEDAVLSGRGLARRLGVDPSTISRRKDRADFSEWSQGLDPEGIAWIYVQGNFVPQLNRLEAE